MALHHAPLRAMVNTPDWQIPGKIDYDPVPMDPRPIQYSKPIVENNPERPNHFLVRIDLDRAPDQAWITAFQNPPGLGRKVPLHRPEVRGGFIYFSSPPGEESTWSKEVIERIEAANAWFVNEHVPQWRKQEEAKNRSQQAADQRIREAQARLDKELGA